MQTNVGFQTLEQELNETANRNAYQGRRKHGRIYNAWEIATQGMSPQGCTAASHHPLLASGSCRKEIVG